ncbi:pentatricopeptide repeat-containing protein At4g02750-like [Selaginella moellendorffii]|uniref:pentatricopeptide repeat-containing protein At4g02750-like n=1 Tax=Selaginella moellendorffii TaxID=88036 RepID=UPI000D1C831B|nr:pentatricopeptide repeat-containing protein At4g02750-like [Selaginella moellendorffii]|eukprot:XP_024527885.1 pentatricopeptide repeat-containing protein At4g02750-like [Selaginella moellendorffii]
MGTDTSSLYGTARDALLRELRICKSLDHLRELHSRSKLLDSDVYASNLLLQIYGNWGAVTDARRLFDRIQPKNAFTWAAMLATYARNGHLAQARSMYEAMPNWSLVIWNVMLAAFARNKDLDGARQIFSSMREKDVVSWTTMLSAFAVNGYLLEAQTVFEAMPERNLVTWNSMLAAYVRGSRTDEAGSLFDSMPERDIVSWTTMLMAYAQAGYLLKSEHLFKKIPEYDLVSSNAMLSCYCQIGEIDLAERVFDGMKEKNIFSWNTILAGYAHCGHNAMIAKVLENMPELDTLFDSMEEWDVVACNAMLTAYAQSGSTHESLLFYVRMPFRNTASYNALMVLYARACDLHGAKRVFDRIEPDPDMLSWNSLLSINVRSGNHEIFSSLNISGRNPDDVSCICILMTCSHAGDLKAGISCFCSIHWDYELEASKQHFSGMIDLLARSGYIEEARDLIATMPFVPDSLDWTCLLAACKSHKQREIRAGVAKELLELKSDHTAAYLLLANAFSNEFHSHGPVNAEEKKVVAGRSIILRHAGEE